LARLQDVSLASTPQPLRLPPALFQVFTAIVIRCGLPAWSLSTEPNDVQARIGPQVGITGLCLTESVFAWLYCHRRVSPHLSFFPRPELVKGKALHLPVLALDISARHLTPTLPLAPVFRSISRPFLAVRGTPALAAGRYPSLRSFRWPASPPLFFPRFPLAHAGPNPWLGSASLVSSGSPLAFEIFIKPPGVVPDLPPSIRASVIL